MNWILCEDPGTPLWCLQPVEKCKQTRNASFRSRSKSIRDSAITRRTTPAVQSLGKLCHGYSCEWVSGQKPRLPKDVNTIMCKTDNCVPLVVTSLSISSWSNSSSTSTSQGLSSTSPAQERSDELAPREWCGSPSKARKKNKKRDGNRDSDNRLRDLLEWLEEFTDNLH